ncbi:MAG: endonuclease/exonuclease/phosphatase family protein [Candidatus Eisenbacteria bacterium]
MRSKSWKMLVLVLALAVPSRAAAATADTLTVVTLNLWHDQHEWPKRLAVILAELRRLRPDVVCLQEVLQNPQLRNQAETLGDSLGCHVQFASVDGPERPKRYGNAILTPHRVLVDEERNLAPADDYRAVAHVRFAWRGREVDAYATHLHHTKAGGAIRATQIRHLVAYVDSTRGKGPVVIGGDFNCELGTPEMALMTSRYRDVSQTVHPHATRAEAATYNPLFEPDVGVIDHLFVESSPRRRVTPVACEVIFRTPAADSVWASDHFGLVGKIAVAR